MGIRTILLLFYSRTYSHILKNDFIELLFFLYYIVVVGLCYYRDSNLGSPLLSSLYHLSQASKLILLILKEVEQMHLNL